MIVPPRVEPGKTDDATLLRRFAEDRSDTAFAELVRRHVDLVHSAALRRCGDDSHLAKDAAQQVFVALARHAGKLADHPALSAWLFTATRNAALNLLVAEQRRRERETAAMKDGFLAEPAPEATPRWEDVRPVLDAAMDELSEADRTAVLLRFFERRSFAEIGATLQLTENAARMRTERALEKLRARLAARGIKSLGAAFGSVLIAHAVAPAPAGLAAAALGAALGTGSAVGLWALLRSLQLLAKNVWFWSASVTVAVAVVGVVHFSRGRGGSAPGPVSLNAVESAPGTIANVESAVRDGAAASDPDSAAPDARPTAADKRPTLSRRGPQSGPANETVTPSQVTAPWVMQSMAAAYARLTSYQDTGELVDPDPKKRELQRIEFKTYFAGPNRLRFESLTRVTANLPVSSAFYALTWFDGKRGGFVSDEVPQKELKNFSTAIWCASSQANGAGRDIPALLDAGSRTRSVAAFPNPTLAEDEVFEGTPCYHVRAVHPAGYRYELWIGKTDFLIRKLVAVSPRPDSYGSDNAGQKWTLRDPVEEIHRDIAINIEIPAVTFTGTAQRF